VTAIWHSADPVLRPYVVRAGAGLTRLSRADADSAAAGKGRS